MRILIVEDNSSFRLEVEMYLNEIEGITTKSTKNSQGACSSMTEEYFDLIILDLMLEGSLQESLQIAEKAYMSNTPFVILTGIEDEEVYKKFFNFFPIGFFTKPLDKLAFKYIIDSHRLLLKNSKNDEGLIFQDQSHIYTFIKKRKRLYKLNYPDIRIIRADGNYLTINTAIDKYVVRYSLSKFMDRIVYNNLLQIQRNYVVNIAYVDSISSDFASLSIGDTAIPIGRTYRANLKNRITRIS